MIIEEVEIRNIFNCKQLHLQFGNKRCSPVYVVQNNEDPKCKNILTLAVQLLCSAKYANFNLCDDSSILKDIREGFVRMKFILPIPTDQYSPDALSVPIYQRDQNDLNANAEEQQHGSDDELDLRASTSQEAQRRLQVIQHQRLQRTHHTTSAQFIHIDACRKFRKVPNQVIYSINNGPKERCSLPAFHGRFYLCLDYMLPFLKNLSLDFNGDWLIMLSSDLNEKWNRRAQLGDPFERFVSLYRKYGYPEQHILSEVTRAHLSNMGAMEALQKTYVIKTLRDTRGIFEFITAGEYTVYFYVPHYGRYADVMLNSVDDLNFDYIATYIQDNSKLSNQKYSWTDAQPAIRDMLLIAFQISLSFHCKQQIIYLNNFEEISNYQAIQFATTAYFQKLGIAKSAWTSKNYLQRIVDVCIASGTAAIIEYPGGTPLHPVNAYLLKSFKFMEAGKTWLSLKIINGERYTFEYFLESLQDVLKNA